MFEVTPGVVTTARPSGAAGVGVPNALIELLVNDEHLTAITDAEGRFAFEDVPPGVWRLRVVRAAVPSFYFLETPELTVTLAPAGTSHVVLRIVPKSQ